jgi:phospholipase C
MLDVNPGRGLREGQQCRHRGHYFPRTESRKPSTEVSTGMEQIRHFVLIMMENRSFDHYFGALNFPRETGPMLKDY